MLSIWLIRSCLSTELKELLHDVHNNALQNAVLSQWALFKAGKKFDLCLVACDFFYFVI